MQVKGYAKIAVREWLSILERMHIVSIVPPYSSNLSARLTKTPKIYFIDTGLACRLQGWTSAEPILTSPQQGHLFENLVFSEIFKLNMNYQLGWQIYHWRSRDGEEVDFLLERGRDQFLFIESKVSPAKATDTLSTFPEVRRIFKNKIPPYIVCHQEGAYSLNQNIPIAQLKNYLLSSHLATGPSEQPNR